MKFGKLDENNRLTLAPKVLRYTDDQGKKHTAIRPTEALLLSHGYLPVLEEQPSHLDGYNIVATGYVYNAEKNAIECVYEYEPIVYTMGDYDAAMEDYLRFVREGRGYTTREPSDYINSVNPRWAQDARDWIEFRDEVMTYALNVINTYTKTGNAPTLAEFKAGFPRIEWTYQEEV
jgi:hypothetical protein